jgi:TonB family protein
LDFGSLPVTDVYPRHIPDLFSGKPVVVTGRYTAPAQGTVRLTGKRAGDPYTREISVALPTQQESNPALSSLWAREKIDDLMSQDWGGLQRGSIRKDLREQITTLGLNYHLMTQFTSFVAVEERVVTDGGKPKRIQVPVELAEGVQYEQGWSDSQLRVPTVMAKLAAPPPSHSAGGVVGGVPGGIPGGQMGGVVGGIISSTPAKIAGGVGGGNASGSAPGIGAGYGGGTGGGVFRVGGGVSAPHAVSTPSPMCPATTPSCQGTAVLSAVVGENGKVREIRFVRSAAADLDTAVSDAVRQWKFNPAMKDGKPVAAQVRIEVAFAGGSSTTSVAFGNEGDGMTLSKAIEPSRSIDAKLHPQLVAAYDCWRAQADKSNAMSRCKLDSDTVLVQVLISGDPESALKQLKALGFEPLPVRARQKQLVGRIAVEKLIALTNVDLVQFVAPAARN